MEYRIGDTVHVVVGIYKSMNGTVIDVNDDRVLIDFGYGVQDWLPISIIELLKAVELRED